MKEGDEILYFHSNLIDHLITKLYTGIIKSIKYGKDYHNKIKTIYTLKDGFIIDDTEYMVFNNENEAINIYNKEIDTIIDDYNKSINRLKLNIKELEHKYIRTNLL